MGISKQENLDVAMIMMLTAEQKGINPNIAELLQRGAALLRRTTYLYILKEEEDSHVKEKSI